ncbi:hypothetical protein LTR36_001362 [Oleoguttula mirabilis]|uniref:Spc7 kinetochore protein domain-containing protein n=1 Tax=Oleoguttula mirabilis TaxID=1507867 RepID=A0AAV9JNJ9_9PEZI|nr:hypothetical protein LTR36_001362 [Oleoguttula mirabilis]
MAIVDNKENVAPLASSDPLQHKSSPSKKASKKGRSKSIGPGDLITSDGPKLDAKQDAKNRRKSTYVPATKSIISADVEKAERQAARRRTLANRRVSFAPEATLHTWDVIEFMRDPTTSTDSSDQTRRASNITRSSNGGSPFKDSPVLDSDDGEPPSTPPEREDEAEALPGEPAHQRETHKQQRRRSSGIPPMNFNNPEDYGSSSGMSGSSDVSESEEDEEEDSGSEDATGTAMSLDLGDETVRSSESGSSTSSSARLEAALRQAAHTAGTRGIDYDENGEDMSMELAGDTVTNAFKPWVQRASVQTVGSASLDQENINPFSPAFKAEIVSRRPATIEEENTEDMSMDVTREIGGIVNQQAQVPESSPADDATMEFTQAVGKIYGNELASPTARSGQKRRRSTTEAGSPGAMASAAHAKRRRSSVARSSMGDDTMDLTVAIGGIQDTGSPAKAERRKSVARRRSSGMLTEQDDATMDFTQAVGGIKAAAASRNEYTASSFDENEELTMELTIVLGGIKAAEQAAVDATPVTPETSQSPVRAAANTTPKDQERFINAPDSGPRRLLTPIFQKQVNHSAEKSISASKRRKTISPGQVSWTGAVFDPTTEPVQPAQEQQLGLPDRPSIAGTPKGSPLKNEFIYPTLPSAEKSASPIRLPSARSSPVKTPTNGNRATPNSELKQQLDAQLQEVEPSPSAEKVLRSSPARLAATPEKASQSQDARASFVDSLKLMSTPRKETLKNVTPRKQNAARQTSPPKTATPSPRPTPKGRANLQPSPARQLSNDLLNVQANDKPVEKVHLQSFLEQAGIRFMDLTASKRRLTTAPTPSKARRDADTDAGMEEGEPEINLENAVVAAACTQPEHDMYQHACHELKHYISEGKKVIKQLEAETYRETPPLIQAYVNSSTDRKVALDTQMRDMKTHARLRSKEMWYGWRSQLLEDLMKALSGIGEGLLRDDEMLQHAEQILDQVLPGLTEQHNGLQVQAEELELATAATSEEEREELQQARESIVKVDGELAQKRRMLEELQQEALEHDRLAGDLQENKAEFTAAIQEAERVREACRGVSLNEISSLKESIKSLEESYGWTIASASSSPPTVTMTYKSQLQLFFHPAAFQVPSQSAQSRPNAPISLSYIAQDREQRPRELTTILRFFLQLLRASLHALPQCSTPVGDLLALVSNGWDTALSVAESERRLCIESMTEARIVSDERLAVESTFLLPKVRTKVRVAFELLAAVGEGMELSTTTEARAWVVYGEKYNEDNMTKFVTERISDVADGWSNAVREMREKLVAKGAKGMRK